ncbi:MAG: hypothetical protein ABIK42_04855 [candidate division WOR-3 bacterium]
MDEDLKPGEEKRLEFKPDEKRLKRLARFRQVVLFVTLILVGVMLLVVLFLPARVGVVQEGYQEKREVVPVEEARRVEKRDDRGPETEDRGQQPIGSSQLIRAARAVALIDSGVGFALSVYKRAEGLILGVSVREDNVEEVFKRIGMARAIAESARATVGFCEQELVRLKGMLGQAGVLGLRLGAAYSAARDYLNLVREDMQDRQSWLDYYEQGVRAFVDKDMAEFDIKMNVAGGYQRSFEVRQRRLVKAGERLKEAMRVLEGKG